MSASLKKAAKWVIGYKPDVDEPGTTVSSSAWFAEHKQRPSTLVRRATHPIGSRLAHDR